MTLPATGYQISMSQVNTELNITASTQVSLNDTAVRSVASKTTNASQISMSDLQGKSARVPIASATTYTANQTNLTINVSLISGYIAGKSDVTITVNSGVYIYATSTSNAGLTITGATSGDTIKLVNNGYILGCGGSGGSVGGNLSTNPASMNSNNGGAGGPALSISYPITITNNGYIAGGGGGGATATTVVKNPNYTTVYYNWWASGGGGAGGGNGGAFVATGFYYGPKGSAGGAGGGPGASGSAGPTYFVSGSYGGTFPWKLGGGGGRILPGSGGLAVGTSSTTAGVTGNGGGAGGSAACDIYCNAGGAGGSGGNAGSNANTGNPGGGEASSMGGGGGGWGASGGTAYRQTNRAVSGRVSSAGAGGAAIQRNGYTITWAASGTVYGSY